MELVRQPLILIRKGHDWHGRPIWTWRCTRCPRKPGRKPVGGDHRVDTFTSRTRRDYPSAFQRCKAAGLKHAHDHHNLAARAARIAWNRRMATLLDEVCRVST